MIRRIFFCSSGLRPGFPKGWGIPKPATIRLAPTEAAMETRLLMRTAGIPARSSSLTIVAPQRVPVPQVEVKITPTRSPYICRISWAISRPNRAACSTEVAFPAVV
jgi:hypothetical protein